MRDIGWAEAVTNHRPALKTPTLVQGREPNALYRHSTRSDGIIPRIFFFFYGGRGGEENVGNFYWGKKLKHQKYRYEYETETRTAEENDAAFESGKTGRLWVQIVAVLRVETSVSNTYRLAGHCRRNPIRPVSVPYKRIGSDGRQSAPEAPSRGSCTCRYLSHLGEMTRKWPSAGLAPESCHISPRSSETGYFPRLSSPLYPIGYPVIFYSSPNNVCIH